MKKKYLVALVMLICALVVTSCSSKEGGSSSSKGNKTEITLLIGKEEVATQLEEMTTLYNDSQDKYSLKIIPLAGQSINEKYSSLIASGNAPTILNLVRTEDLKQWEDTLVEMSDLEFVDKINENFTAPLKLNDKQLGIPLTVESYGFIYNKEVLDKAYDGKFDPKTIKTRDDLEKMFKKIEALEGVSALEISPMNWSLGTHYTNILFANTSENAEERLKFMTSDIGSGAVNLSDNEVYKNWVATFDLMKKYNISKDSPLSPQYDDTVLKLANGEIGVWFMGDWVYPQLIEANPDAEFGFLPVATSNNAADFGNSAISIGVPSMFNISSKSTDDEIAGAKDFLTWLFTSDEGQDFYVNQLNFMPVSEELFKVQPEGSLAKSVLAYMGDDQVLEWMNMYYPADFYEVSGNELQKYANNEVSATDLATTITSYWKDQAGN